QRHGFVVSWVPYPPSPAKSQCLDDPDDLWEDLSADSTVTYHPSRKGSSKSLPLLSTVFSSAESVKIKADKGSAAAVPPPIEFEVSELNSYQCRQLNGKHELSLNLSDGTLVPTFIFLERRHEHFLRALREYLTFKRSRKDHSLYLVKMPPREALQKSFDELDIFSERARYNIVSRFLENPYVTTMDGFAKMTQYVTGASGPSQAYHLYSTDSEDFQQPDSFTGLEISEHGGEPGFEVVVRTLPKRPDVKRSDPLGHIEWALSYDNEGRVMHEQELRERIFRGGVEPDLRKEVWTFLLDYYSFDSTYKEREARRKSLKDDYYRMKLQWKSFSEDQESRFADFRERKNLVEKDVSRTDRAHAFFQGENNSNVEMLYDILMTYCMYNFDLGYVQGMSDLLSPILIVMENEADAFWCFVGFVKRVSPNFDLDQSGMKKQLSQLYDILSVAVPKLAMYLDEHESGNLYFCFRWLLVLFKREFKCEEIMRLWEVLWSGLPCKNFHLLICVAILDNEKDLLIENNYGLNEILKHINDMSYQIDLDKSLSTAEAIYQQLLGSAKLPESVRKALDIPLGTTSATQSGNDSAAPSPEKREFLTPEHVSPVELLNLSSPDNLKMSSLEHESPSEPMALSSLDKSKAGSSPEVVGLSRPDSGRSVGRTTSSSSNSVEVIPDRDSDIEAHYERHFDIIS
ncbi:unnamed protein product, partial [Ixodes hexagonus]